MYIRTPLVRLAFDSFCMAYGDEYQLPGKAVRECNWDAVNWLAWARVDLWRNALDI